MRQTVILPPTKLLIGGDWGDAQEGKRFSTINPANEETIAEVARGGVADVDVAVKAARQALSGPWGMMSGIQRARILNKLADILRQRFEEVALLESVDAGKPLAATRRQDIANAIDTLEHFAGWADKLTGDVVPVRTDALTYTRRVPVGVVAAIVPWNFPLMNAVWKIAPALACGCTVVMKPAELTPLSALWLGAAALEAGLPPGVLNVVPGPGSIAGNALVAHPGVNKIAFTGSPGVGKTIMRAAAENVTHVGLELGGKAASVVFADADMSEAVRQITAGAFFNAGQVCSSATRIIVEDSIHDAFVSRLAAKAEALRVGDPVDPTTTMGPVISQKQMDLVLGYIDVGRKEGAVVVSGGERIGHRGFIVQPTVFAGVEGGMRIAQEEIFGPSFPFCGSATKRRHSVSPTAPPTALPQPCGRETSSGRTASPTMSTQGRLGSTRMVRPTPVFLGAEWAVSPGSVATSAARPWTPIRRRRRSGCSWAVGRPTTSGQHETERHLQPRPHVRPGAKAGGQFGNAPVQPATIRLPMPFPSCRCAAIIILVAHRAGLDPPWMEQVP